jgi:hypothetical protein
MIQRRLESRLRALEQRVQEETRLPKALLPNWLMEELEAQGLRSDAAGRVDWDSLRAITGCSVAG